MTFLAGVSDLTSKRIAIAGLGEIGKTVAHKLAQGLPGLALAAITTRDRGKAQAWLDREGISCPLVSLDELPDHADLVVECAPAAILDQICRPMLSAGKQVMVLSSSALLPRPELVEPARSPRFPYTALSRSLRRRASRLWQASRIFSSTHRPK